MMNDLNMDKLSVAEVVGLCVLLKNLSFMVAVFASTISLITELIIKSSQTFLDPTLTSKIETVPSTYNLTKRKVIWEAVKLWKILV